MFSLSASRVGLCDPASDPILSASVKKSFSCASWQLMSWKITQFMSEHVTPFLVSYMFLVLFGNCTCLNLLNLESHSLIQWLTHSRRLLWRHNCPAAWPTVAAQPSQTRHSRQSLIVKPAVHQQKSASRHSPVSGNVPSWQMPACQPAAMIVQACWPVVARHGWMPMLGYHMWWSDNHSADAQWWTAGSIEHPTCYKVCPNCHSWWGCNDARLFSKGISV